MVWWGNLREIPLGRPRHGGRIILKLFFEKWWGRDMDWIDLAQDWDRWCVVNP
jgi:hypothetical protein